MIKEIQDKYYSFSCEGDLESILNLYNSFNTPIRTVLDEGVSESIIQLINSGDNEKIDLLSKAFNVKGDLLIELNKLQPRLNLINHQLINYLVNDKVRSFIELSINMDVNDFDSIEKEIESYYERMLNNEMFNSVEVLTNFSGIKVSQEVINNVFYNYVNKAFIMNNELMSNVKRLFKFNKPSEQLIINVYEQSLKNIIKQSASRFSDYFYYFNVNLIKGLIELESLSGVSIPVRIKNEYFNIINNGYLTIEQKSNAFIKLKELLDYRPDNEFFKDFALKIINNCDLKVFNNLREKLGLRFDKEFFNNAYKELLINYDFKSFKNNLNKALKLSFFESSIPEEVICESANKLLINTQLSEFKLLTKKLSVNVFNKLDMQLIYKKFLIKSLTRKNDELLNNLNWLIIKSNININQEVIREAFNESLSEIKSDEHWAWVINSLRSNYNTSITELLT